MQLTIPTITLLSLAASAVASNSKAPSGYGSTPYVPAEFYSLGCPNTTKPIASFSEQITAFDDFSQSLYIDQKIDYAFDTYVAKGYINHAPEVATNGSDAAKAVLKKMLPGGHVVLERVFVGYNKNLTAFGTAHFKGIQPNGNVGAIADIIRLIGTCLVENWDVATAVENSTNPIAYFK